MKEENVQEAKRFIELPYQESAAPYNAIATKSTKIRRRKTTTTGEKVKELSRSSVRCKRRIISQKSVREVKESDLECIGSSKRLLGTVGEERRLFPVCECCTETKAFVAKLLNCGRRRMWQWIGCEN